MTDFKREVPDLTVYCNTCRYSKAVERTRSGYYELVCGHMERVGGQ